MTDRELMQQALEAKSLAGILLREHDTVEQAIRYAERKAQYLAAMSNAVGCDYALAAEQLRAYQAKQGDSK